MAGLGEDWGLPYLSNDFNNYYLYTRVDQDVILAVVANNSGLTGINIYAKETNELLGVFIAIAP